MTGGAGHPARRAPQPGDGWTTCACGSRHWGLHGAAGLLLFRPHPPGGVEVVLQHRALWSDQGGTWGIPGGAIGPDESPQEGALREAAEEAAIDPDGLEVLTSRVLDHGTWSYTTVVARATGPQEPRPSDPESLAISWVAAAAVADLPLLTAFGHAWPGLRTLIEGDAG